MAIKLSAHRNKITYDTYVQRDNVQLLRKSLSIDDPAHLYNYLANSEKLKKYGLKPEDFGIEYPYRDAVKNINKKHLEIIITKIIRKIDNFETLILEK